MCLDFFMQRTLSIIKPDAVSRNLIGKINTKIEDAGFKIIAIKNLYLTKKQASEFYAVHKERTFFNELVDTMTSGMVIVQILEGENAVEKYREIMGATNPKDAKSGTIRAEFALSIGENSVHGSDSIENAKREISFFFSEIETF